MQSEQKQQDQDKNKPGLVYIDQSIDTCGEESYVQVNFEDTHLYGDTHVKKQQQ